MSKEYYSMITSVLESKLEGERWDPEYWNPKWFENIKIFSRFKYPVKEFGQFIIFLTYGKIKTGKMRVFKKKGIRYIDSANLGSIGFDFLKKITFIANDDDRNAPEKKPMFGDILLARDGVGCIGRNVLFLEKDSQNYTISDHVDIIRLKGINPFYVSIYLHTKYGEDQIHRIYHGVGSPGIHFHHIKSFLIPLLPKPFQDEIENKYRKTHSLYSQALKVKENLIERGLDNDGAENYEEYKNKFGTAYKKFSALVLEVEEYISKSKI